MNIQFLPTSSSSVNACRFKITNTSISFVNGLRRTIISQTPTVAIHVVEIHENTTTINDEMLAHRLGFLPLNSALAKQLVKPEQCTCDDGCPKCEVEFKLRAKNTKDDLLAVTNKHLVTSGDIRPTEDTVLILNLAKNQEISITAKATKNVGARHAKWNPATVAAYRGCATIELNPTALSKISLQDKELFVKSCASQVFGLKGQDIEVIDPNRCTYCRDCFEMSGNIVKKNGLDQKDPKNSMVYIQESEKDFIFVLETTGVLTAFQLLQEALSVLEAKMLELQALNRKCFL
jgi:DNA-directed RNA polymerase II subunit RPB3